ncbi:MAG TPA: hypothetical protein VH062_29335 [Polyangiaceae bacterium]|nr:hypothetical protein [Polyangiaceae bacterium]
MPVLRRGVRRGTYTRAPSTDDAAEPRRTPGLRGCRGGRRLPTPPPSDAAGDSAPLDCTDLFNAGKSRCCPQPLPDCSKEPDGYPGYACTPPESSLCSCACSGGKWVCGCILR